MLFPKKVITHISVLIVGTGMISVSLANGAAWGQMSQVVTQNSSGSNKNLSSPENTSWELVKIGDSQPLTEKPITLSFNENGRVSGSSGCNRYVGAFNVKGNQFSVKSPLASTMMACPEALMKQEQQFLQALTAAKDYKINSKGDLEIQYSDAKQTKLLIFTPEKTSTTKNKMVSLENTSWQLITLGKSQPLTPKPITLTFSENNRLAGSSGCNRYMGGFSIQGEQFSITSPLGSTRMACPETVMKQENEFLKALAAAKSYEINAKEELEIQYSDGKQNQVLRFAPVKASSTKETEKIIYVNNKTVPCTGVGKLDCLQVKESLNSNWQFYYQQIEGFNYKPGYLYKLRVREEVIPNPPADGSSRKWILVEVMEKTEMKVKN